MFYVYVLCRDAELTQPFYVGKGVGRRWKVHIECARAHKNENPHKERIIRKVFKTLGYLPMYTIWEGVDETEAYEREIDLIARLGRRDLGTGCLANCTDGGEGVRNIAAAGRERISAARRGDHRPKSAETRAAMSAALRTRMQRPEERQKVSDRNRLQWRNGKPLVVWTPAMRQAASECMKTLRKGQKMSDQARAAMRAAWTPERRRKASKARIIEIQRLRDAGLYPPVRAPRTST